MQASKKCWFLQRRSEAKVFKVAIGKEAEADTCVRLGRRR